MAKVKIQGHASGTGVLTVTAPNTSTDRTITLPDFTGTLLTSTVRTATNEEDAILIEQSDGTDVGSLRINNGSFLLKGKHSSNPVQIQTHDGNEDIEVDPDGFIKFETGGSERMRLTDNGLTFNGDTAAANALDDYEEGNYNAVISGSTSGTFNMDSNDNLSYTKIGRLVSVQGYIGVSSGSVSGNLRMTLPFTPTNLGDDGEYNFSSLYIANTGNTNSGQKYLFLTGDAYGWFYKVEDSGSAGYMHQGDVDSAFQVAVSFTYISG